MGISNSWLTPLQRSYQQIKTKLLDALAGIKDENGNQLITDFSEGNLFIILVSLFSAIAEVLHYYIDNNARESFLSTARRYESVVKHGTLVDYHPRGAIAATVDVIITRPLTSENLTSSLSIPKGLSFIDSSSNNWLVAKDVTWYANTTTCRVPLIQHSPFSLNSLVGTVIPSLDGRVSLGVQTFASGNYYEDGTMSIKVDGESWVLVPTFAYSKPTDKHFIVTVGSDQDVTIVFGDGTFGKKPSSGSTITAASCYVTKGLTGNVNAGSINTVPASILSSVSDATCSNLYQAGGGSDYETFRMLKEHIPLSVKTLGVAITKQDFIDLAKAVSGVNKAAAEYECGRKLTVYITPDNGTIASNTLCNTVYNYLHQHSPLCTWLNVKSAGVVNIILEMDVTGKKSYTASEIQAQVTSALLNAYSIENAEIGGDVRISDIYALIDNLSTVDYLHITKFYMKPWPTTIYGNKPLIVDSYVLNSAKGSMEYIISFTSSTAYTVRSVLGGFQTSGTVGRTLNINDTINGFNFGISISSNDYVSGYKYSFKVSEPNHDYEDPGYNLPLFQNENQLTLTVNEVL